MHSPTVTGRLTAALASPRLGAAVLVAIIVAGCVADTPSIRPSQTAGPVPSATATATPSPASATLEDILETMQGRLGAGISVAVITPSGTWTGAAGPRDPTTGAEVTPATIFAIGSITKTATSALVLHLAEDGRVDLDAPISRYLPSDLGVDLNGASVRQVLGHRSGIGEYILKPFLAEVLRDPLRRWEPRDVLANAEDPQFAPGYEWRYSNTNYILLGLLVEEVTGRPFGDVLREELLGPLDLPAFIYQPDEAPQGELAVGLLDSDGDGTLEPISGGGRVPTLAWATAAGSAGGIGADAVSVALWGRALFDGDVLSDGSLATMLDFSHPDHLCCYGLGVQQVELGDGLKVVGHSGGLPGFVSSLIHDRDRDITVVVLVGLDLAKDQDPNFLAALFLEAALAPGGGR